MRDEAARMAGRRLFQAHRTATGNDRLPKVDRLMHGTVRVVVADERRWRRPSTSATQQMLLSFCFTILVYRIRYLTMYSSVVKSLGHHVQ